MGVQGAERSGTQKIVRAGELAHPETGSLAASKVLKSAVQGSNFRDQSGRMELARWITDREIR